jgi:hypothetical protein
VNDKKVTNLNDLNSSNIDKTQATDVPEKQNPYMKKNISGGIYYHKSTNLLNNKKPIKIVKVEDFSNLLKIKNCELIDMKDNKINHIVI